MEPLKLGVLAGADARRTSSASSTTTAWSRSHIDEPTDLAAITVETYTARRAYEIAAEYRAAACRSSSAACTPTLRARRGERHTPTASSSATPRPRGRRWSRTRGAVGSSRATTGRPGRARSDRRAARGAISSRAKAICRSRLMQFVARLPLRLPVLRRDAILRPQALSCARSTSRCGRSRRSRRKFIFFIDDNIASDHKALTEFCHALIAAADPLGEPGQSRRHAPTAKLMQLIERAGNWGNVMGFESITPREPARDEEVAQPAALRPATRKQVRILRDHGMQTWAAFTLGYDHDTPESIAATARFRAREPVHLRGVQHPDALPEHAALRQLEREGRHLYDGKWWLHPEYRFNDAAFVPKRMTPDELTARLSRRARALQHASAR